MLEKNDINLDGIRLKSSKNFFMLSAIVFFISYLFVSVGFYENIAIYVFKISYFVFLTSLYLTLFFFFKIYTSKETSLIINLILLIFFVFFGLLFILPNNLF